MDRLTLIWLLLVGSAFVLGRAVEEGVSRRLRAKLARVEALAFTLENQPSDWPPLPREELAKIIRDRLKGGAA